MRRFNYLYSKHQTWKLLLLKFSNTSVIKDTTLRQAQYDANYYDSITLCSVDIIKQTAYTYNCLKYHAYMLSLTVIYFQSEITIKLKLPICQI